MDIKESDNNLQLNLIANKNDVLFESNFSVYLNNILQVILNFESNIIENSINLIDLLLCNNIENKDYNEEKLKLLLSDILEIKDSNKIDFLFDFYNENKNEDEKLKKKLIYI